MEDTYSDGLQKWTPAISARIRYFDDAGPVFSPDFDRFLIISTRGDPVCDCGIGELSIYDVGDILSAIGSGRSNPSRLKPVYTLTRRSFGKHFTPIFAAKWDQGGRSVVFYGMDDNGLWQYFRLDIASKAVTQLTRWPYEVMNMQRSGDAYLADLIVPKPAEKEDRDPAFFVNRDSLRSSLMPDEQFDLQTFASYGGESVWPLVGSRPHFAGVGPWFSSDSQHPRAIVLRRPRVTPKSWFRYDALVGESASDVPQFQILDFKEKTIKPVADAPSGLATRMGLAHNLDISPSAIWSADQNHIILVNTAIPLQNENVAGADTTAFIASYDLRRNQLQIVEPLERTIRSGVVRTVSGVKLLPDGNLLISHTLDGRAADDGVYHLDDGVWVEIRSRKSSPERKQVSAPNRNLVKVSIRQSANDPPVLIASKGGRTVELTGADPALSHVWWAHQTPVQWVESGNKVEKGGLLMPRHAVGRVPLVVQAYSYYPDSFEPDGPNRHAYAAQALVAKGFAVLNIDIPSGPTEMADFRSRLDRAIAVLDERGLIDPQKIGIVGFSRAGTQVYNAISHTMRYYPAAVVIDDSFSGSFGYYLSKSALLDSAEVPEVSKLYGGSFWLSRENWLANEPTFNADKIHTAALFTVHNQHVLPLAFDTLGAFHLNRRPIEFFAYPDAGHTLALPSQRMFSQNLTVDWMMFWLKNRLPGDADRANRWRKLKEDWVRQREWEALGHPIGSQPQSIQGPVKNSK